MGQAALAVVEGLDGDDGDGGHRSAHYTRRINARAQSDYDDLAGAKSNSAMAAIAKRFITRSATPAKRGAGVFTNQLIAQPNQAQGAAHE